MADELAQARSLAAGVLSHPVPHALPGDDRHAIVAASVAGDPPQARVAWVDADGTILARIACPPGRPSRFRPVVATSISVDLPGAPTDHVVVCRVAPGVHAARVVRAGYDDENPSAEVGSEGLVLVRLPSGAPIVSVEALDARGEPVGTLVGEGLTRLNVTAGSTSGRPGLTHGMAAGIGGGGWVADLAEATFAAGYDLLLPTWEPDGFSRSHPRVEPDVAYPAAPPAVLFVWSGPADARVLLRQAPAPLANPEMPGRGSKDVDINGAVGILRGTRFVTLVWETEERAFGVQVLRMDDAPDVALRLARSVPLA
jgi:hypothetical protein